MYIQVNIGRNYTLPGDTKPSTLSGRLWEAFQVAAMDAIMDAVQEALPPAMWPEFLDRDPDTNPNEYAAFEVHTGTGTWDGVTEESAHVSVFWEDSDAFTAVRIRPHLHKGLEALARQWHQDAIAFVVTDSTLASA